MPFQLGNKTDNSVQVNDSTNRKTDSDESVGAGGNFLNQLVKRGIELPVHMGKIRRFNGKAGSADDIII